MERSPVQPGSGTQGSVLGIWEYISQTNEYADHIPAEDRWKWVDDLTTLDVIDIILVSLLSYNFMNHGASDTPIHN